MSLNVSELYETYWEPICRWLHRNAPDLTADDIEDVAMVVFEKAARAAAAGTYRDQGTPGSWLYMVARNALKDYWREQQRRVRTDEITNDVPGGLATADAGSSVHLTRLEIAEALLQLSPRYRMVLIEQYWVDASQEDTALLLGVTPGGLRHMRNRARARLYHLLTSAA